MILMTTAESYEGDPTSAPSLVIRFLDGGNRSPAAVSDSVTTPEDTPVVIAVLSNDSDPDGDPLTIVGLQLPGNGSAVLHADNTIT